MTNQFPLISVVMATYNGAQFLAEQLDSILNQTYPNIEIIAVDDCSTDNTLTILHNYAERFAQLRVISNESNLGYVKNFEKGMLLAKGELIALSDQDDIWMPEKLLTLFNNMADHDIVYSNSELIDDLGRPMHKKMSDIRNQISYDDCVMYIVGAWAPGHAMLLKAALVRKCLPFPTLVTHDFWLGFVATCNGTIQYIDVPLVKYRQHTTNAIGANTNLNKAGKRKKTRNEKLLEQRQRMTLLYEKTVEQNARQKMVVHDYYLSYRDFSLQNNWLRMRLFFRDRKKLLAYKKKSDFMQVLFCLKMFFKLV